MREISIFYYGYFELCNKLFFSVLISASFEMRFMSLFHSVDEFPSPQPFQDVPKLYNSRVQQGKLRIL